MVHNLAQCRVLVNKAVHAGAKVSDTPDLQREASR